MTATAELANPAMPSVNEPQTETADATFATEAQLPQNGTPALMRFTVAQFDRLAELHLIPEKSELVDGQIILLPAPAHTHGFPLEMLHRRLSRQWHEPRYIATQATHRFVGTYRPMPDLALYDAFPDFDADTDPLPRLIVEVADSTQRYDLGDKRLRYAREGVPEYWVLDVPARRMHVLREPVREASDAVSAWRSAEIVEDEVTPLCAPDCRIVLEEVLPPRRSGESRS
ncbi:MAG: Uma2 family endonuclease [Planctomycetota bacterium]